jgi:hypothetical protein
MGGLSPIVIQDQKLAFDFYRHGIKGSRLIMHRLWPVSIIPHQKAAWITRAAGLFVL